MRSELTGTWLNYALPVAAFASNVEAIRAGQFTAKTVADADRPDKPLTLTSLGIVLVPEVVSRTPPYIDRIVPGTAAAKAGLRPDDLVVMLDSSVITSCRQAATIIEQFEHDATIRISVLRDDALLDYTISASAAEPTVEE
jgi:serine protease Do